MGLDEAEALERQQSKDAYFGGGSDFPQNTASLQTFGAQDAFGYDYSSDDDGSPGAAWNVNVSSQTSCTDMCFKLALTLNLSGICSICCLLQTSVHAPDVCFVIFSSCANPPG